MRRSLMAALIACLVVVTGCSGSPGSGGVESTTNAPATVEDSTEKPTTGVTGATTSPPATSEGTISSTSSATARRYEARTRTDRMGNETTEDGSTASGVETEGDEPNASSVRAEVGAVATVTRVIDGDTMEVEFADGRTDTVRLIGVDTPETDAQNTPAEFGFSESIGARDHLTNWGERATGFATDRLEGERVELYGDPQGDQRGSYGRLLAYVYLGEENFNYELVAEGYARVYESSFEFREAFETAAERARANETGLWAFGGGGDDGSTPTETEDGRSITSDGGELPSAMKLMVSVPSRQASLSNV
jgi:micrococcal nuclease